MRETEDFWARQYGPDVTVAQVMFDVTGGVFLPFVCLWFDPIVFRGGPFLGAPMFGSFRIVAYSFIVIEMTSLLVWLSFGRRLVRITGVLQGMLFAGAAAAGLLGIVLFPFSLIGLGMAGLGLLGFSPFLVAWIFLRNWLRSYRVARREIRSSILAAGCIGGLVVTAVPFIGQTVVSHQISNMMLMAVDGDETVSQNALARLSRWRIVVEPLTDLDRLALDYERECSPQRRRRLAATYSAITQSNVDERLAMHRD